jgi:hypothetical protein
VRGIEILRTSALRSSEKFGEKIAHLGDVPDSTRL